MADCVFLSPECAMQLDAECRVHWLREDDNDCRYLPLGDCATALEGRPIALILPVEVTSAFLVDLPAAKERWLRQAMPFAVEEMLAQDVELFHLALGAQQADQRYRVLAINRALLAHCLGEIETLGVNVSFIHVDADMLPLGCGTQALLLGGRGLLGGEGELRMAFAPDSWPQIQAVGSQWELIESDAPYALLASGRATAINLAQGEFARRPENQAATIWRPAALVLGGWVVLHMGFSLFQSIYYERQAEQFAQSSVALYQELFPDDRRIVNLRAQFAEHLRSSTRGADGFVGLLQRASVSLSDAGAVSVSRLDYNQNSGNLSLQVKAKDFAELEKLRQLFSESGLAVQVGSASREEDGVSARVVLGDGL